MTYASSRKVQAHPNRGDPKKELIEITTCSIDRLVHDILWEKLRLAAGDKYCIRHAKSVIEPWTSLYWFTWSQMLPLQKTEIAQLWKNTNVLSLTQLTAFCISVLKNMPKKRMFQTGKLIPFFQDYEKTNWGDLDSLSHLQLIHLMTYMPVASRKVQLHRTEDISVFPFIMYVHTNSI